MLNRKETKIMDKMNTKVQADMRSMMYTIVSEALDDAGYITEMGSDGRIIDLGNGYYGKLKISICDATKFSITDEREKVAAKAMAAAERAEKARIRAEEKERKRAERAAKAQEKIAE